MHAQCRQCAPFPRPPAPAAAAATAPPGKWPGRWSPPDRHAGASPCRRMLAARRASRRRARTRPSPRGPAVRAPARSAPPPLAAMVRRASDAAPRRETGNRSARR
jgi:hypothetical protein